MTTNMDVLCRCPSTVYGMPYSSAVSIKQFSNDPVHTIDLEDAGFQSSLAVSLDGRYLATGKDQTIQIWDVINGSLVHELHTNGYQSVGSLAYSMDGFLAVGLNDGVIDVWAPTGNKVATWQVMSGDLRWWGNIPTMDFSPDGSSLAIGINLSYPIEGHKSFALTMDAQNGNVIEWFPAPEQGDVRVVKYNPNNSLLAVGSYRVFMWDIQTKERVEDLRFSPRVMSYSPDGTLAMVDYFGYFMGFWNPKLYGENIKKVVPPVEPIRQHQVTSISFSPTGEYLALGTTHSFGGGILIYHVRTWDLVQQKNVESKVSKVAYTPDGALVVWSGTESWGGRESGTINIYAPAGIPGKKPLEQETERSVFAGFFEDPQDQFDTKRVSPSLYIKNGRAMVQVFNPERDYVAVVLERLDSFTGEWIAVRRDNVQPESEKREIIDGLDPAEYRIALICGKIMKNGELIPQGMSLYSCRNAQATLISNP